MLMLREISYGFKRSSPRESPLKIFAGGCVESSLTNPQSAAIHRNQKSRFKMPKLFEKLLLLVAVSNNPDGNRLGNLGRIARQY